MPEMNHQRSVRRTSRVNRANRAKQDAMGTVEELAEARRAQVFRQDVEHAPHEPTGQYAELTPELLDKIKELRGQGMPYLNIGIELNLSHAMVGDLCRKHGFPKGEATEKPWRNVGR